MNKVQEYALAISDAVASLFDEDNENHQYDLHNIDATAFFTGFAMAFALTYNRLTGASENFIGSTHLANRLAFQYLMENGKERGEEEAAE